MSGNRSNKNQLHMKKLNEFMQSGRQMGDWIEEYVDFHIKLYGMQETSRVARNISKEFPGFSALVAAHRGTGDRS